MHKEYKKTQLKTGRNSHHADLTGLADRRCTTGVWILLWWWVDLRRDYRLMISQGADGGWPCSDTFQNKSLSLPCSLTGITIFLFLPVTHKIIRFWSQRAPLFLKHILNRKKGCEKTSEWGKMCPIEKKYFLLQLFLRFTVCATKHAHCNFVAWMAFLSMPSCIYIIVF